MARLEPFPGMYLPIGSAYFEFLAHPLLPYDKNTVYVLEGGEALIYQVRHVDTRKLYALKVFKPAYREEHIARVFNYLAQQSYLPGVSLQGRVCITKAYFPRLVEAFPEVEYAVLMPWLEGRSWAGILLSAEASSQYTLKVARSLVQVTANVLWNVEARGLAHTDLAGSNVLIAPDYRRIHLLDIENMYVQGIPAPKRFSHGSPGYQHQHVGRHGQWCPEGDRFAGAILLTEMLTWWDPRVRARVASGAETLFRPDELQVMGTAASSWYAVRNVLYAISPQILGLFDQAWASATPTQCPALSAWATAVLADFS